MTDLQAAAAQYLATRRAVGFKLTHVEPLLGALAGRLRAVRRLA
jgi:hypothetical protein